MSDFTRLSGAFLATLISAIAVSLDAQAPRSPEIPAARSQAPAVTERNILEDGTIEIKYEDGTVRRVPKEAIDEAAQQRDERLMPASPPGWLSDPVTLNAFRDALNQYYIYRKSGLQHRERVFEWQLFSSRIIFAIVLALVAAGMSFAALQFYVGFRRQTGTAPAAIDAVTQLDLSTAGLKVSSPVLGVIILVISLAFFYLYLVYVYPISEIW